MEVANNMKLSNKEKILLGILGSILAGSLYYQFIYKGQVEKINILKDKKNQIEIKYQEIMETIKALDERKEKVSSLKSIINLKSKDFYPMIVQEKIILELDNFMRISGLKGDIGFTEVSVESVKTHKSDDKKLNQSSFQNIIEKYNGTESQNNKEDKSTAENETNNKENEKSPTVEIIKATINFKGDYDSLQKFISSIETSKREISINDISTTVGYNGELTGSINIEFYGLPKISSRDNGYLQWNMDGSYGKQVPFLIQKPEVVEPPNVNNDNNINNFNENTSTNSQQVSKSDFVGIIKSTSSDLPTVTIGKANDKSQSTYVSSDNSGIEDVQIELKKVGDKYYYKYKVGNKFYPKDYNSNGIEFTPASNKIIFDVNSESRVNNDDKSGIEINVLNSTDKIVEVQIQGDDKGNPRVTVTGDSSKVNVVRK
jgi:type IV pilus assembly protein PilO